MKKSVNNTIGILLLLFVVLFSGCKEDEITNISAETLVIDHPEVTLNPEDSIKLTATVMPENAGNRTVFWKSSDSRIASVTDEGWVKATRPGMVTITAIAYSNTEIRSTVQATVTGIPDDVVSGVAGTYTGDLDITGMGITPNTELTLEREGYYSVRLITSVDLTAMGMGNVPINILTGVDREGESFRISGEGVTPIGPITVNGTVDADGNIALEIYVAAFAATATYTGKNVANIEEIVTGTYVGDVMAGAPVGSNVEVIIKRENNKYKLQIDDEIASYPFQTEIEITVLRSGNDFTISSNLGAATVAGSPTQVTITSGTITSAGDLDFDIEIMGLTSLGAPTNTATYTGQKLENLAKAASGTYEGVVAIGGNPVSAADAEMTLTAVNRTTVRWTTSTQVTLPPSYGAQTFTITESDDFRLTVSGGSGTYTLTGQGSTILGDVTVTTDSKVEGKNISLTMDAGLGVNLIYTGQKQ
jgi:hypothetical protein